MSCLVTMDQKIVSMVMDEYDVIEESHGERDSEADPTDDKTGTSTIPIQGDNSSISEGTHLNERNTHSISHTHGGRELGKSPANTQKEETIPYELLCPRVNCQEKIIICLDFSSEMDKPMFRTRAGDKFAPLKLVKRALGFYIHSKHRMDSRHEYALMLLQDTAIWVSDFTNEPRDLVNLLEDLEDTNTCEKCDLSSLFQAVYDRIPMPTVDGDPVLLPPPYIVRVLIIYGRSHCSLEFPHKEAQRALFSSPYFFVDAFYIHESPSDDNMCQEIFDSLCDLDYKGFSYIFEASRNPTKIYDFMAQLLAHPLQRPAQKEASYKLKNPTCTE